MEITREKRNWSDWASMSEPYSGAFNVKFCLYNALVCTSQWAYLVTCIIPRAPIVLPHSVSFIDWTSMSKSETTLEWHQQRERERTVGQKSHHFVLPTCCYLTHTRPCICNVEEGV